MKRTLFSLLIVLLLSSVLIAGVCAMPADFPYSYIVENDEVTITGCPGYTGDPDAEPAIIPDEIDGMPVTAIGDHAFYNMYDLCYNLPQTLQRLGSWALAFTYEEITVPDSVTEIGPNCFAGVAAITCKRYSVADQYALSWGLEVSYNGTIDGITEIEEDGFTYWVKDGEATLVRIISLGENVLYIPEEVQGYPVTQISSYAAPHYYDDRYEGQENQFYSVVIPSCVKYIDNYAFYDCSALTNVYLCEGVEYVGNYAFGGDVILTLPDSLKTIGEKESYEAYEKRPIVYAAEGSAGLAYAQRIGAKYYVNQNSDGTWIGYYAGLQFVIRNGEATMVGCTSGFDPFLPMYIDGYPLTRLEDGAFRIVCPKYLVLPPTLTSIGPACFNQSLPENFTLFYYPGTPAEELVKNFSIPHMSIYDALEVPFDDVPTDSWYYGAVSFAYYNGLMDGVSSAKFDPQATMTRAMLVTVLWRLDGGHADAPSPFTDVAEGTWYTEAVLWAAENGVVNGVGNGKFNPNGTVTREQIAAILCRYAELCGIDVSADTSLNYFPDGSRVSSYAVGPMKWAVETGLIGGRKNGNTVYLVPHDGATRAEVAAILMRFLT